MTVELGVVWSVALLCLVLILAARLAARHEGHRLALDDEKLRVISRARAIENKAYRDSWVELIRNTPDMAALRLIEPRLEQAIRTDQKQSSNRRFS